MKKLILLLSIISICYACKKQTVEPIQLNSDKITQSPCDWDGTYIADSAATKLLVSLSQGTIVDTILNLSMQIVYLGDSVYSNGQVACKYDLDNVTKSLNFLSPASVNGYRLNTVQSLRYDSVTLITKSNKYIALIRQ